MVAILHYFYTLSIFQFGRIDFMEQRAPPSLSVAAFLDGFLAVLVSVSHVDFGPWQDL